jgi:lysophospholipase L1-like esterase
MALAVLSLALFALPGTSSPEERGVNFIPAQDPLIRYTGRADLSDPGAVLFDWPGVSILAVFEGTGCAVRMDDDNNVYNVEVDGKPDGKIVCEPGKTEYTAVSGLKDGSHTILIFKRTEASYGVCRFLGFVLEPGKKLLPLPARNERRIELIGDSLSCGYGIEATNISCGGLRKYENAGLTCVSLLAKKWKADLSVVAISGKGVVRNYGDSGPVSEDPVPFYYNRTLMNDPAKAWDFTKDAPGLVIIHLGWNDLSPGTAPDTQTFTAAFHALVEKVRKNYPSAAILCLSLSKPQLRRLIVKTIEGFAGTAGLKIGYCDIGWPGTAELGCDYHPNSRANVRFLERLLPEAVKLTGWGD